MRDPPTTKYSGTLLPWNHECRCPDVLMVQLLHESPLYLENVQVWSLVVLAINPVIRTFFCVSRLLSLGRPAALIASSG